MRRAPVALLLGLAVLAAGCGRDRLEVPETLAPAPPGGTVRADFPEAGVRFEAPRSWGVRRGKPPQLAVTSSGTATIAVWRYERTEPLPRSEAALAAARKQLLDAIEARDRTFRVDAVRTVEVDGAPALQVVGRAKIEGNERRVRSTHAYAKGAELVVDAYAAEADFDRADREAFGPLLKSLKIDPPRT